MHGITLRLIARSKAQVKFEGIRLNRNYPSISHLLFADNLIIFGKANEQSAQVISKILMKYHERSEQKINLNKSSIFITRNTNAMTKALVT